MLSSFDGIRRETAKMTLVKLIEDGRIHPARIEEMYYQSKAEMEDHVFQAGEQAVFEANCGEFHEELVRVLGRLRFRTSYGRTCSSTRSRSCTSAASWRPSSARASRRRSAPRCCTTSERR